MEVWIDNSLQEVKFGLTGTEEIIQNIKLILNTPKGTVPLDRDFGISWKLVDRPITEILPVIKAEIVRQIQKYEPRAKIKKVKVEESELHDGILKVKVLIEVGG